MYGSFRTTDELLTRRQQFWKQASLSPWVTHTHLCVLKVQMESTRGRLRQRNCTGMTSCSQKLCASL